MASVKTTPSRTHFDVGAELWVDPAADVHGLVQPVTITGSDRFRVARGEQTLDGSNPTSIATGLTKVLAATATLKTAVAPGDDPIAITVDYAGAVAAGQLDLHAWKNTGGTDPTLVASTNSTAVVSWIAFGT